MLVSKMVEYLLLPVVLLMEVRGDYYTSALA